ncbi:MAG TPA: LON peptidase substrate-binding domain-containing protein, partial [Acidimicrobiia bacterium]
MFPLGTVLVPSAHLPLHIFEPRYRALAQDCLAGDREFGVVLIERGSEVGGGDVRFGVGTVARIVQAVELPDGRWLLDSLGTERFRIQRWLEDDPYPQAEVEPLAEAPTGPDAEPLRAEVERLLRQV